MIANLVEYFDSSQEIFLEKISYKKIDEIKENENLEVSLLCEDNVEASIMEDKLKVVITRSLKFDPEVLFSMSVAFGAVLRFNTKKSEIDWNNVDISKEIVENGEFITLQLVSRISLIIGEITSSFGQQPLILPPKLAGIT